MVVRWPGATTDRMSRWHVDAPVDADVEGRTQCGKRYPRRTAEVRPRDAVGAICKNCVRAWRGTVPGDPADGNGGRQ